MLPLVFDIFRNVFQVAMQYLTELVERVGTDIPVLAETVQLPRTDLIFLDQFILRDLPRFHRFPEPVEYDHAGPSIELFVIVFHRSHVDNCPYSGYTIDKFS